MTTKKNNKPKYWTNTKQLNEINFILESNPLSRDMQNKTEAQKLFEENKTIDQRTSNDFVSKLKYWQNEKRNNLK